MYNQIPKYQLGKVIQLLEKTAATKGHTVYKYLGYLKNLAGKDNKELVEGIDKYRDLLIRGIKYDKSKKLTEGTNKELFEALQKIAQGHRKTSAYQSRKKTFWDGITRAKDIIRKKEAQVKPTTETQSANPIPGTTLSARWQQAKTWMNNHPKTTIGVPLLALGTGPGRYVTGNAVKAIQSNPENWFNDVPSQSGEASDFIVIDGTRIPIKRSAEGYFVPVAQDNVQVPSVGGDNIDQTLAGITNENLGGTPQQQQGNMPVVDQQAINDLFEEDQW